MLPGVFARADQLKSRLGLRRLLLLNDFTALALSLPHLGSADLRQVGAGTSVELAAKAVLGPGTGLGVSGVLFHDRGCWLALTGEGGHCSLAPTDARESARSLPWPGASLAMSRPSACFPAAACRC
jgi:glucokinase